MYRLLLTLALATLIATAAACEADDATDDAEIAEEPTPTEEPEPTPTPTPEPEPTPTPDVDDDATDDAAIDDDGDDALRDDDIDIADDDADVFDDDLFDDGDDAFGMEPDEFMEGFEDEELGALLLEIDALPEEWDVLYEGSIPDDLDPTMGMGSMMGGPCGNDPEDMQHLGDPVQVGRLFAVSELGPFFGQDLLRYDDSTEAADTFALIAEQFDCESWTEEDPMSGTDMEFTVEELDFPELGDETLALSIGIDMGIDVQASAEPVSLNQMDDPFGDISTEMIVVRHQNLLSNFTHIDPLGMGNLDLEATVTEAIEKLEDEFEE